MKKFFNLILFLTISFCFFGCGSNNAGKILFSTKAIKSGKESEIETKKSFTKDETIYGRAYLTEKIGTFNKKLRNDDFIAELYIDGNLKYTYRALQNNKIAKPEFEEFIFYIYKTKGRPDFPPSKFKKLSAGEHNAKLVVKRVKPSGTITLAEDTFTFVK